MTDTRHFHCLWYSPRCVRTPPISSSSLRCSHLWPQSHNWLFWLRSVFVAACGLFCSCGEWGLLCSGGAFSSHCGALSCFKAQAIGSQAKVIVAHGHDRGAWWGKGHGVPAESDMTWQLNNNKDQWNYCSRGDRKLTWGSGQVKNTLETSK